MTKVIGIGVDYKGNPVSNFTIDSPDTGVFYKHIRINPTTLIVEVWNGSAWVAPSGGGGGTLPTGAFTQMLRYGLSGWEAVPEVLIATNTETTLNVNHKTSPTIRYSELKVGNTATTHRLCSDGTNKYVLNYSGGTTVYSKVVYSANQNVTVWADNTEQYIRMTPSGTVANSLTLKTTSVYNPDTKMIQFRSNFSVFQSGKITSADLAGTEPANLIALADGTIARDTNPIVNPPQPIVYDYLITTPSTMIEITAAELGIDISQDVLLDKLVSFEAYFYDENNRTMSTVDIRDKVATRDTVAIDFAQQYPVGTIVRVLLTLR